MAAGSIVDGGSGAVHEALIYHRAQELVTAATAFLRAGIVADAPVLVVLGGREQVLLRDALGRDGVAIEWVEPADWYTFPAHTLRRAYQFAQRHPGRTPRIIGEVVWAGRSAVEITEWARYEALVTAAFPATPVLCAYDATALDPAILATAGQTHPFLRDTGDGVAGPSAGFVDPAAFLVACDDTALPAPTGTVRVLGFHLGELRAIRRFVAAHTADAGLGTERGEDLVTAVNEAATNAVEHGGGRGMLWIWTDPTRVMCDITNPAGQIGDPFTGHLPPDPRSARGRGLWFMRQLADIVEVRTAAAATTVRLHMWR